MSVEVNDALQLITASATTTASEAACPLCQQPSQRVHSHYLRTLTDLPGCGQRVKWIIQVRRFRCLNPECSRKLFSERLPTCAPAYARRTLRQGDALSEVACTLEGKVGEGIVGLMSKNVSHDTLLRLIRRRQPEAASSKVRMTQFFPVFYTHQKRSGLTTSSRTSLFASVEFSRKGNRQVRAKTSLKSIRYKHIYSGLQQSLLLEKCF